MGVSVTAVFLVLFLVLARREPRSMVPGIVLILFLLSFLSRVASGLLTGFDRRWPGVGGGWALLVLLALMVLAMVALGVLLVLNGLTLVRKEGRSLAHLLSLILGVAMLAYIVVALITVITESGRLVVLILFVSFPLTWLGLGLVAFLVWGRLYDWWCSRHGGPVAAVVVLGAGLAPDGSVTPLLARRVDAGVAWAQRVGTHPVLVMSGGQGSDERVSEGRAMGEYALAHHELPGGLLLEQRSVNTEENLRFSRELLEGDHVDIGRVAVVTSNYHAFRAALLMRRAGLGGYSIGAPTARYYWPSAVLREYVAILDMYRRFTVISFAVLCIPAILDAAALLGLFG